LKADKAVLFHTFAYNLNNCLEPKIEPLLNTQSQAKNLGFAKI
jgi:hypothetical protein